MKIHRSGWMIQPPIRRPIIRCLLISKRHRSCVAGVSSTVNRAPRRVSAREFVASYTGIAETPSGKGSAKIASGCDLLLFPPVANQRERHSCRCRVMCGVHLGTSFSRWGAAHGYLLPFFLGLGGVPPRFWRQSYGGDSSASDSVSSSALIIVIGVLSSSG